MFFSSSSSFSFFSRSDFGSSLSSGNLGARARAGMEAAQQERSRAHAGEPGFASSGVAMRSASCGAALAQTLSADTVEPGQANMPVQWTDHIMNDMQWRTMPWVFAMLAAHPEGWTHKHHYGKCSQSCPCCRAHNAEDMASGCFVCHQGFKCAQVSRRAQQALCEVPRHSASVLPRPFTGGPLAP